MALFFSLFFNFQRPCLNILHRISLCLHDYLLVCCPFLHSHFSSLASSFRPRFSVSLTVPLPSLYLAILFLLSSISSRASSHLIMSIRASLFPLKAKRKRRGDKETPETVKLKLSGHSSGPDDCKHVARSTLSVPSSVFSSATAAATAAAAAHRHAHNHAHNLSDDVDHSRPSAGNDAPSVSSFH